MIFIKIKIRINKMAEVEQGHNSIRRKLTPEERQARRREAYKRWYEKNKEKAKEYNKNYNRVYLKNKYHNMTPEEKQAYIDRQKEYYHRMSPEKKEEYRQKQRESYRKRKEKQQTSSESD